MVVAEEKKDLDLACPVKSIEVHNHSKLLSTTLNHYCYHENVALICVSMVLLKFESYQTHVLCSAFSMVLLKVIKTIFLLSEGKIMVPTVS